MQMILCDCEDTKWFQLIDKLTNQQSLRKCGNGKESPGGPDDLIQSYLAQAMMTDEEAADICQQRIKPNERCPKLDSGQEGNLTEAMIF